VALEVHPDLRLEQKVENREQRRVLEGREQRAEKDVRG
jgi:hypothetical protein